MPRRRAAPVDVSGARVLVIDDNAVNRAILSEQMEAWQFDACAAESGPEGLSVLKAASQLGIGVDCVVLDYQMPGMNGADVARAIRADSRTADLPIVLLTSVDHAAAGARGRELGFEAQLVKPARSSALLEAVVSAIQRHRGESAASEPETPAPPREPVAPPAPAATVPAAPERRVAEAGNRVDILIAEDNEVNQLVFTQILDETRHSFAIVSNGRRAVEAFGELRPRMILMDVSMPEMNGLEATAAIRERERGSGRHTAIVGVTAHALKGDRERCLEAGMDDYLSKPIRPNALLEKVSYWLESRERRGTG